MEFFTFLAEKKVGLTQYLKNKLSALLLNFAQKKKLSFISYLLK